jgi:hypothetical protein
MGTREGIRTLQSCRSRQILRCAMGFVIWSPFAKGWLYLLWNVLGLPSLSICLLVISAHIIVSDHSPRYREEDLSNSQG